jgi:hypothetical protein
MGLVTLEGRQNTQQSKEITVVITANNGVSKGIKRVKLSVTHQTIYIISLL